MKQPNSLEEAHNMIKDAMGEILQEIIVIDENGEHHIVFIHDIVTNENNELEVIFSTPSNRDHVYPYIVKAINEQFNEAQEDLKKKSIWYRIKAFIRRFI